MPGLFYFGCWDQIGHYIYTPDGKTVPLYTTYPFPWTLHELDGGLCPGVWFRPSGHRVTPTEEQQGLAKLHYRCGWTAMAFWDRSIDPRSGSNAVLIAEGELSFSEMTDLFHRHFPGIWKRLNYPILDEKNQGAVPV